MSVVVTDVSSNRKMLLEVLSFDTLAVQAVEKV